jgi:zona occludens toxin
MIFGNEGMPRSGKSLDSMQHIIDSLNAGRTVVTNVIGVNHKALSEYLAIPLPTVERLLIVIEPAKGMDEDEKIAYVKREFYARRVPDCLWIWDEINQFWPPDRQPLPPEWAKFVTEHGHEGIDVLIMGQDLSELHTTWRKRLQRYTRFTKLDMLGKDDQFHWASYTNVGKNKYRRTADGKKPYNKAFFPLYKSHRETTTNTGNYKDGRFGVFQPQHKVYAVLFGLLLCGALYNIWGFFNPDLGEEVAKTDASEVEPVASKPQAKQPQSAAKPAAADIPPEAHSAPAKPEPIDYLDKFAQQYDLRLSGIIDRKDPQPGQAAFEFEVDFLDTAYRVKERMRRVDIASLGWAIERHPYGIRITKDDRSYVARPWPLDNWGKVPQQTITALGTAKP